MTEKHYHYGAGLYGYLYQDGPYIASTYDEAMDALISAYELTPKQRSILRRDGCLDLNRELHGNEYCEITPCYEDCEDAT